MKCFSVKKIALGEKNPIFAFQALVLKEARKTWWKVLKKQLQGSRKPAQGTKGGIAAFGCDKSANLMPQKCGKSGILAKKASKT